MLQYTASMEGEDTDSNKEVFTTVKAIWNLSKDIQNMKTELKRDMMDFKEDF